jgi:hypothetical protein
MLKSVFISLLVSLNLAYSGYAQGNKSIFTFAYITMSDGLTIFTDIQEVGNINDEESIKLFKVYNSNQFVNFLIKRTDIDYSPKYQNDSGVRIIVAHNWSEIDDIYKEKRKLSGDKHYVVEGFGFFNPKSSSKSALIRN